MAAGAEGDEADLFGSSGSEMMKAVSALFTRFAACRTCSTSCDRAGRTWDSSRGTKDRISSGQISKKLSIHLRVVVCISSSVQSSADLSPPMFPTKLRTRRIVQEIEENIKNLCMIHLDILSRYIFFFCAPFLVF